MCSSVTVDGGAGLIGVLLIKQKQQQLYALLVTNRQLLLTCLSESSNVCLCWSGYDRVSSMGVTDTALQNGHPYIVLSICRMRTLLLT